MIGNVSSNTGILTLQGENDTQTPVQQACMLQQRLTELNHPDHMLITYPGPGHQLSPVIGYFPGSGMFLHKPGPTEEYALAGLYAWLESHYSFGLAYHPCYCYSQIINQYKSQKCRCHFFLFQW